MTNLNAVSNADVRLTLEISATAVGFDDRVRRVVCENANQHGESEVRVRVITTTTVDRGVD